jgi:small-conductance mechanosensitive channel
MIRVHVPVGVSYGSNPKQVEKILLDVANNNSDVIKHKPIEVWFTEYGDSSLNFTLLVWTDVRKVGVLAMRSSLYYNIFEALKEAGIAIPFPQRDLHIRSGLFPTADGSKE